MICFIQWENHIGKKFVLITSAEVLEYVKDPVCTRKLFTSLLKKNGVLAIMM